MNLQLDYKPQDDYLLSSDLDLDTDYKLKSWASHIHIKGHDYLHDPKFKTRNWTIIMYPDSAPDHWRELIIDMFHVPFSVSPLHDRDLNSTGEPKKPHWHVALVFDGPKSWLNVIKITRFLNCAVPVDIISLNGMIRYFAHLDNPEKAQYDPDMIEGYCGFNVEDMFMPSNSEQDKMAADMIKYIYKNHIDSTIEFDLYCIENHYLDWYKVLTRGHAKNMINNAINDMRRMNKLEEPID